jgi:hypothetical protein
MNVDPQMPPETAESSIDPSQVWVAKARRAYESSARYVEGEVRANWERDVAHFQNRHAPGSKYHTSVYKHRSKVFRPKVRMNGRAWEAAVAAALFSTSDLLDVEPHNHNDPQSVAGADLMQALVQYRLENSLMWFQTVIGAAQDGYVYGVIASYQDWQFEEEIEDVPMTGPGNEPLQAEDGSLITYQRRNTLKDRPWIEMIPPENIRFDPGCDWRDPVGTSTYLVRVVPMYVDDVMARVERGEWLQITRDEVKSSTRIKDNTIKRAREQGRPENEDQYPDNPVVYCHQNFIRDGGQEWVYWTLGTEKLLSHPMLLKEAFPIGERPIVIGKVVIETHRPYPTGVAGLISTLQEGSNEVANQRMDNVSLVLNKRYMIKRGKQVDLEALMRNVPGGGIVTDDPVGDVRVLETNDVTGSSYQEQDRYDVQIDEMAGVFSGSAVQSNRQLNETVGGMNLMQSGASAISEYSIRTFVETWVEPVLRQIIKLEQAFETDATILAVAGQDAKLDRFGIDQITDDLLSTQVRMRVNVGIGATNPQQKVERVMFGVKAVAELPGVVRRLRADEIVKEVFGALGYKNGQRFIASEEEMPPDDGQQDPTAQIEMQKLQLMQQRLQMDAELAKAKLQAESQALSIKAQAEERTSALKAQAQERAARMKTEADERALQFKAQNEQIVFGEELRLKRELGFAELALRENLTMAQLEAKLQADLVKTQTQRDTTALVETNRMNEMDLKRSMGSGI